MNYPRFPPNGTETPAASKSRIAEELERSRRRVHDLTACGEEELLKQHSPLMSPLVWDLAHVGSQEELWLVRDVGGMEALRPEIDRFYDAFVNPRSSRPTLPLLAPTDSRAYIGQVRAKALDVLERVRLEAPLYWRTASRSG